jgi:hypothetical protein
MERILSNWEMDQMWGVDKPLLDPRLCTILARALTNVGLDSESTKELLAAGYIKMMTNGSWYPTKDALGFVERVLPGLKRLVEASR